MSTLPVELCRQIIQCMYPYLPGNEIKLATLALVNRAFYDIACEILYRSIVLPPLSDDYDPEDPYYAEMKPIIPSFETLARNAKLAGFVQTFKCWGGEERDILDSDGNIPETDQTTLCQAADNMKNIRTLRLTPNRLATHVIQTLHLRPAMLQSLTIIGFDPCKHMRDAGAAAQSGSLTNLTSLHLTFRITWSFKDETIGEGDFWIRLVSYVAAAAEISCPALETLKLDSKSSNYGSRIETLRSDTIQNMERSALPIVLDRAKNAQENAGTAPCKLSALHHLSLKAKYFGGSWVHVPDDEAADYKRYTEWVGSFFGACLRRMRSVEVALRSNFHADFDFVRCLCDKAGRELTGFRESTDGSISLEWSDVISESTAPSVIELIHGKDLGDLSLSMKSAKDSRDALSALELSHYSKLFGAELGLHLSQWTSLQSLSIGDSCQDLGSTAGLIRLGWLGIDSYEPQIEEFIANLPGTIRELRLTINAEEAKVEHDAFSFDEPEIFKSLRALTYLHIACWTEDDDGSPGPFPENELFVRRLACEAAPNPRKKILACTYVEMSYQHDHRCIVNRTNHMVTLDGQDFVGEDAYAPWTYEEDEVMVMRGCEGGDCDYDPFRLADPYQPLSSDTVEGEDEGHDAHSFVLQVAARSC